MIRNFVIKNIHLFTFTSNQIDESQDTTLLFTHDKRRASNGIYQETNSFFLILKRYLQNCNGFLKTYALWNMASVLP